MSDFERFHYKTLDDLLSKLDELDIELPVSENFDRLAEPVQMGDRRAPNRFAIQPMEGCDCTGEGAPGELTRRRYLRFAAGGAGLIWFEACAVVPEGRANPNQMQLTEATLDDISRLLDDIRETARAAMGPDHEPVLILQMTHSGRYSRPEGEPAPIIAHHSPILAPKHGLSEDYPLITDEELDRLQDAYLRTAALARKAGFDGVDVKACHGYLIAELLESFTRRDSRYGGPELADRTRLLREVHRKVAEEFPDLIPTSRLNTYDAIPHPYGWGVDRDDPSVVDLSEPLELVGMLRQQGAPLLNVTAGNPYWQPHYNRPYDYAIAGFEPPEEHPLVGVNRIIQIARQIQTAYPGLVAIGSGYSYLRQFMPYFAAGAVREGWASMIGLGRQGFAYPDFPRDIFGKGAMDPLKSCITCSCCTQMMRDGQPAGCVIRDKEVYGPMFREGRRHAPDTIREQAERCRDCVAPTCQDGCPADVDVPAFVRAVADGDIRRAYDVLRANNPLPELCAYICPVEVQCEGECIQGTVTGDPVHIRDIQRYVCRTAREEGWAGLQVPGEATGRYIAVVGAGPAGMACALQLLEAGHSVTIIEASDVAGGLARQTIPSDRLQNEDVEAELHARLAEAPEDRLKWRFGTALGRDVSLDELLSNNDAVVLGMGLMEPVSLAEDGEDIEGVETALDFLRGMKDEPTRELPGRVAVLGGGNTAMDAALVARRHGAEDVYLIYRRSFTEMPAWPEERDRALEESVHFILLTQPTGYQTRDGRLTGVRTVRTALGEPDASGRRRPEEVPDTEAVIEVDMAVEAIGQRPSELIGSLPGVELNERGLIAVNAETMRTSREGVYAAGDLVNGGTTAVRAVAEGLRAGQAICRSLAEPQAV
ncbi:MAG: FAD-dependent oxidoreductase [Candidatus Brocadiia bacterium]